MNDAAWIGKARKEEIVELTARIINNAELMQSAPILANIGIQLETASIALKFMSELQANDFLRTNHMVGAIQGAEVAFRKIAEDPELARLIHDRICERTGALSAFDSSNTGPALNYVEDIAEAAAGLKSIITGYYPPLPSKEAVLPRMAFAKPDTNKLSKIRTEISQLKGALAKEGRARNLE